MILCASALVLLADPERAVKQWAGLLKRGSLLIMDVPFERCHLPGVVFEEVGKELGIPVAYCRAWVKNQKSLEKIFVDAGLEVEKAWKAPGYEAGKVYDRDKIGELFDRSVEAEMYAAFGTGNFRDTARSSFVDRFRTLMGNDGMVEEDNAFYVVIGRKP